MPDDEFHILCPVRGPLPFAACPQEEITPLIEHLNTNTPVAEIMAFPRGSVLPDGRLDLCKQSLGAEGCQRITNALVGNDHICSLLLGTDGIGDVGASAVSKLIESNSKLKIVYLGCNGITENGATMLSKSLAKNSCVEGLWLKRNPIGDIGVESISALLQTNRSIRVLDLVNTGLSIQGIRNLCNALLDKKCSIEHLYLGGNSLDEQSAYELSKVLRGNQRLVSLFLNVGNLGDAGALQIAEGLRSNITLRELGLASNGITAVGATHLLSVISSHPSIQSLDLGYSPSTRVLRAKANSLGDEGGESIAKMLIANSVLQRLNVAKCEIGNRGRSAIESALLNNRSLRSFIIDGGLSTTAQTHLLCNQQNAEFVEPRSTDLTLIRSVYRTTT